MAGAPLGNNNNSKGRLITDELRRVCTQSPEKLKKACEKVLEDAVSGNLAAFSVIADRLDGKPAQAVNIGGQEDNPLIVQENTRPKLSEEEWGKVFGPK